MQRAGRTCLPPLLLLVATACAATSSLEPRADYTRPVVLFVSAEEAEIERLKTELGEDFWTVADDAMWYRAEAYDLVQKRGIAHAQVGRGQATFRVGGEVKPFSWAEDERPWFVVFYDGEHEPRALFDIELPEAVEAIGVPSEP